jgi:hypothetical protein
MPKRRNCERTSRVFWWCIRVGMPSSMDLLVVYVLNGAKEVELYDVINVVEGSLFAGPS